jgi:hypothetical protein
MERLTEFNAKMKQQKRTVLLFLGNATCHPRAELSNISLVLSFSNTKVSGPKNQTLKECLAELRSIKVNYHMLLVQYALANMEAANSAPNSSICL